MDHTSESLYFSLSVLVAELEENGELSSPEKSGLRRISSLIQEKHSRLAIRLLMRWYLRRMEDLLGADRLDPIKVLEGMKEIIVSPGNNNQVKTTPKTASERDWKSPLIIKSTTI